MALGNQQMASGRHEEAERSLRRALELGTKHGMTSARLGALGNLALLALADDRLEESLAMSQAVREEAERAGDLFSVAMSTGNIAAILVDLDRPDDAIAPAETAVAAMRELGDVTDLAWALSNLGQALMRTGDSAGAAERLAEGMRHADDTGSRWNLIPLLTVWAELALSRSDVRTAVLCLAVGERCARELEYEAAPIEVRANERLANAARSALGPEPFDQLWASAATIDPFDLARQIYDAGRQPGRRAVGP
jgi:tetratricopeptide (TPR) repeat protein